MKASFTAAILLLLAFSLAASDVITLGPEKAFHDFPRPVGAPSAIGSLIPNEGGWFLLFTRGSSQLRAMQLNRAGETVEEWPLDAKVARPGRIGVRTVHGTYLVTWMEEGADHDVLALLSANGHTIVQRNEMPPQTSLVSLDCNDVRCLGVTSGFGHDLVAFSLDVKTVAGPVSFGSVNASASVVADGDLFKVAWSDWTDPIHLLTVDRNAKIVSDEIIADKGIFVTAARGTQPVYFFVDSGATVKAVIAGQPPKTIGNVEEGASVGRIAAAWNGSEFLVVINAEPPGSWAGFE